MILPLERDELLSRWEGWRDFAEAPALEQPERLSVKQIEQLSEDTRVAYDYHRERYHANFLVKTPQVVRLNGRLWDLLDANQQGPSRVKGAAVIDSPPGLGKTTAVDAFGRAFHQRQILRHGRDFDDGQTLHIPVCRVAFSGNTTTRALNESILNFYNHPSADASRSRYLRNRNLAEGVALANKLKWLANEYPATFLFTGVNMSSTGLLSESKTDKKLAMSQIARRWTRLTLPPFAHPVGEHRKTWMTLLGAIDARLVLANARPHMLREQADYLYERSTGMIGSLFKLITLGAVHAMRDGTEELTRAVLDEIDIDVAAEDAREVVAMELEEKKLAAAKRSKPRSVA